MQGHRTVAIVVAAGSGARVGGAVPKQYRHVGGKAVLGHAVDALADHPRIDAVHVVIGAEHGDLYAAAIGRRPLCPPVIGGATRRESVYRGLHALIDAPPEHVLIHDAARPFVPADVVDRLLDALKGHDGAIPALPVADSLVRWDGAIGATMSRNDVYRVQTPQAFRFPALIAAHRDWPEEQPVTDDAQMVRDSGHRVVVVPGDPMLDKLTHEADLTAAAHRLAQPDVRTGNGFDVHRFAPGDHLWLCGVRIAHGATLAGHSDADVGLHALTDAILGAIGQGDIGSHFPPTDPQWQGAASSRFLAHARDLVAARGGRIGHVDVTLICEAPKVGPHRKAMCRVIAALLGVSEDRVSVKATTTEGLGFTGRREGIAAQATATIVMGLS